MYEVKSYTQEILFENITYNRMSKLINWSEKEKYKIPRNEVRLQSRIKSQKKIINLNYF